MRILPWIGLVWMVGACGSAQEGATEARQLPVTRTTTFGDADGPGALSDVFDVDVDPDGNVYVSEPGFGRVVAFNVDGSFRALIGAQGQGPGEFQFPGNLTWLSDTLTVLDFQRGIHLFLRDGTFVNRVYYASQGESRGFPLSPIALLADGAVASFAPRTGSEVLAGEAEYELWLKMTREGEVLDTLVHRRMTGGFYEVEIDGRPRTGVHPLATSEVLVAPPNGSGFVLASGPTIHEGEQGVFSLHRLDLNGDTLLTREIHFDLVPVTSEDRDSIAREMISLDPSDAGFASRVRTVVGAIEWPAHFPGFASVLAGVDGSVWVQRHLGVDGSRQWDVFDANLHRIHQVQVPASIDLKVVALSVAYGIEKDQLDVPRVVRLETSEAR